MHTSRSETTDQVAATAVSFVDEMLCVALSDGREVCIPLSRFSWLGWLARATPEERSHWTLEPRGFAIYWPDLDDGIEVCHLLSQQELSRVA